MEVVGEVLLCPGVGMGDNRWLGSVPIYNHLPTTLPSFSPQYSPLQDNSIEMVALIAREGWGGDAPRHSCGFNESTSFMTSKPLTST